MSHRYLILGLLATQPMTGYAIRRHVKDAPGGVITTSYGTLYPMLHKMQKEGAVEMEEQPQKGRPVKKLYRITPAGELELNHWLDSPPEADKVKSDFLLRLYLARYLPRTDLLALLQIRRRETEQTLTALHHNRSNGSGRSDWIKDYLTVLHQAEMDWLKQTEACLIEQEPVIP
jgi:DNA-binding PadR family transcriptional regulator